MRTWIESMLQRVRGEIALLQPQRARVTAQTTADVARAAQDRAAMLKLARVDRIYAQAMRRDHLSMQRTRLRNGS
jgi:hypothetical protein